MTDIKTENWLEQALAKRHELSGDPHRPSYHFAAPAGWLNDPNGVIQWNGQYHLFYQHNPVEAKWGPPHWGHAVSSDLVHWEDQPVALTPDMPPVDAGGCWSGCAVNDGGTPTFLYTGVRDNNLGEQTTCLAVGDDTLTHWHKFEGNPLVRTPTDLGITHKSYRDPYVWKEGGTWYQVIGTSTGGWGQALLYRSQDLRSWEYLNPLVPQGLRDTFNDECHTWECPNFFALGDKHVLLVSLATDKALAYPTAFIGDYRDHQFYPEKVERVDWGYHAFYAPLTMKDDTGRRLMWGWLQEQRSAETQLRAGWSGIMSLPRVLTLENGKLTSEPAQELQDLRKERFKIENLELSKGLTFLDIKGRSLELSLSLDFTNANEGGVVLALANDDSEGLYLIYNRNRGTLRLEPRGPTVERGIWTETYECPLDLPDGRLELRVFLDGSAVEVFVQGQCLTGRVYTEQDSRHVALLADGEARLERLEAWTMETIWSNSERP